MPIAELSFFERKVLRLMERFGSSCLSAAQVGEVLGVDPETVRRMHRTPPHRLRGFTVGKELRWRAEDVQHFIDRGGEGAE